MKLLGFPNHTSQNYAEFAVIDPSVEPVLMSITRLGTEEPTERARLITLDPAFSQWGFGTSLISSTIDGITLVNHNVTDGGEVRFIGVDTDVDGAFVIPTKTAPNSIVSSANITGGVSDVDEDIFTPDGLAIVPTNTALDWNVRLKWPTLSGTIDPQNHAMCIVLRSKRAFTGAGATSPTTLPTIEVSLVLNPGPPVVLTIGRRAVTNTASDGQILIFPFSLADFPDVTDFQVYINGTPGLSVSGNQYATLETIRVYYDTITLSSPTHDSGWISVVADALLAPPQPVRNVHYIPDTPWTGVLGYGVMIRSDQAQHSLLTTGAGRVPASSVPTDPVTFVQAGVVCAGEMIELSGGIVGYGAPPTKIEVEEVSGFTHQGRTYGSDAFRRVVSEPVTVLVTRAELILLQAQTAWRRGRSGAFYVIMEPGASAANQEFSAFWATLRDMSVPIWAGNDGTTDMYTLTVQLDQKL